MVTRLPQTLEAGDLKIRYIRILGAPLSFFLFHYVYGVSDKQGDAGAQPADRASLHVDVVTYHSRGYQSHIELKLDENSITGKQQGRHRAKGYG